MSIEMCSREVELSLVSFPNYTHLPIHSFFQGKTLPFPTQRGRLLWMDRSHQLCWLRKGWQSSAKRGKPLSWIVSNHSNPRIEFGFPHIPNTCLGLLSNFSLNPFPCLQKRALRGSQSYFTSLKQTLNKIIYAIMISK